MGKTQNKRAFLIVTDWLPTLLSIATEGEWAPAEDRPPLDGFDQWAALTSANTIPSPREYALVAFNAAAGSALHWHAADGRHRWKLIVDQAQNRGGYSPAPELAMANIDAKRNHTNAGAGSSSSRWRQLMNGGGGAPSDGSLCEGTPPRCNWLFDLNLDPTESENVFDDNRGVGSVVATMSNFLDDYAASEVTCEEAEICGPPDPAAVVAWDAEGYLVPWI
jgi:hypothetical protein